MKRENFLLLSVLLVPVLSQQSLSKVQGITVTRTVQGSSPGLRVSWSAAVSTGRQGSYSDRVQRNSCEAPSRPTLTGVFHHLYPPSEVGISVSWRAPQSDCPITSYEVQYKISSDTSWGTPPVRSSGSRRHDWEGLSPNTSYDVRVRAVSAAGKGAWSDVGQVTTPGVPGPVRSLSATPIAVNGAPALHLRWSPPMDKSGGGLTYRLRVVPPHVTISRPVTTTEYNVTGLRANTSYTVYVSAVSSGLYGPEVPTTVGREPPSRVQGVNVTRTVQGSSPALRVSWSAVNGSGITYTVCYSRKLSTQPDRWTTVNCGTSGITGTSTTLGPLSAGTTFLIWVRAVSSGGRGPDSGVVKQKTWIVPGPVRSLSATPFISDDEPALHIRWSPPVDKAGGGLTYRLRLVPPHVTISRSMIATEYNVTGLRANTRYTVYVSARSMGLVGLEKSAVGTTGGRPIPAGAIVGGLLAIILIGTVAVVAVIVILCVKKKKPPVCLSDGMTKVQGVRHSLKMTQKDEDYEMQPQPEVAYYQSLTVGSLEPIPQSSFSVHVKAMHMERDSGFEREYQTIVNDPNGRAEIAMENRSKNRYINIHTYDHSRVVLSAPDENGSDYINASYIDGYEEKDAYIASQGPKDETVSDFWEMVWEQKSPVIVMLTKVEEKGKVKCEQYWYEELDKPYELKRNLTVTTRSHKAMADYEIRDIRVMKHDDRQSEPLEVVHMQYTGWPDYGVPTHPSSLVKFVQQVRKEYKDSSAPMVVHCSAGVGRTGTFITIDVMMERLNEKDDLNIYQFVTEMRSRRTFMVQTMAQYAFIHDALSDYLTCGDTSIPAHQLTEKIIEMSAVKEETNTTGFQDQFEFLESLSKNTGAEDNAYSKKSTIAKKNRYKDKFPYSNCHLRLHSRNSTNGGDYINASFIDSFSRSKAFIAAQAPLENTKNDVWQLIWQFKIPTVVVLCGFKEDRQETCCRFWPEETIKSIEFDHIKVNHDSTISKTGYEVTRLDAFEKGMDTKQVSVTLFHVNNWSKSGSVDLNSILKLMGDVEGAHTNKKKPIMVMCDDGMGRSGVFICAMSEVERVKVEGQVDVFQTIKGTRLQRPHMVDTPEQYKLCFDILKTNLNSFDAYANFKEV